MEALNNGKHISEALFDIDFSIKCIEYFAGWSDKIFGKTIPVDGGLFTYTKHEPMGVCAGVITLTYPTLMFCWKVGPALGKIYKKKLTLKTKISNVFNLKPLVTRLY